MIHESRSGLSRTAIDQVENLIGRRFLAHACQTLELQIAQLIQVLVHPFQIRQVRLNRIHAKASSRRSQQNGRIIVGHFQQLQQQIPGRFRRIESQLIPRGMPHAGRVARTGFGANFVPTFRNVHVPQADQSPFTRSSLASDERQQNLENLFAMFRTAESPDRFCRTILQRVRIMSHQIQQLVKSTLIGEVSQRQDGSTTHAKIVHQFDSRHEHLESIGFAGFCQPFSRQKLRRRITMLDHWLQRLDTAIAFFSAETDRFDCFVPKLIFWMKHQSFQRLVNF